MYVAQKSLVSFTAALLTHNDTEIETKIQLDMATNRHAYNLLIETEIWDEWVLNRMCE